IFVVGSGAIGCEHLKNLVMCGMGTEGKIHVTDMDSIEQSNLTRQFLFSKNDVSQMKAEVAVKEVKNLNEDFAKGFIKNGVKEGQNGGHEEVVDEEVFSEVFFQDLDIVANALDNVEARVYVDNRCLISKKYLVDAGTSGTKGNVQTIVPFFSEPYGDSVDPPESSIPICTIKNFPFALEHTIEW
ncbi:Ubiquitin-like modifier-activating enzyme 1 Y, partial [Nosema bombycis CQ1]